MQLHEVSKIRELFVVDDVNAALKDGWQIVAVVSSVMPNASTGDGPVACYVMGKKDAGSPQRGEVVQAGFQTSVRD